MAANEIGIINVRGQDYQVADPKARNTLEHIAGLTSYSVVASLPSSNIKTNVVYLIQVGSTSQYTQYVYDSENEDWITLGTTTVNLDDYVAKNQISVEGSVLSIL